MADATKPRYGRRWAKLRREYLRRHSLCVFHQQRGQTVLATDVDHVLAIRLGGTDHESNLQSLCKSCHSRKTATERPFLLK